MPNFPTKDKFTLTSATASDLGPQQIAYDENGWMYLKVRNVEGSTIAANEAMMFATEAATTDGGKTIPNVIDAVTITNSGIWAGQAMAAAADDEYFWVQRTGMMTAIGGTTGAVTIGEQVWVSATSTELDSDGTGNLGHNVGVAISATSGAATTFTVYRAP